jgi:hypothetical protein
MKQAALRRVGRIDLIDLQAISDSLGRDFLPHPFVVLQPSRFSSQQEYSSYVAAIPERLAKGDLREVKQWVTSYVEADIRVECVVSIVGSPRGRLLAHRQGQLGFVAAQDSADHVVDVYAVAPFDLGPAIAGSLALSKPGMHAKIVIPGLVREASAASGKDGLDPRILQRDGGRRPLSAPRSSVARYTRIQSRCQPARDWGFDRNKSTVACVTIKDDGDYIYAPEFEYLTPMTRQSLAGRIDDLIAEDVARLRNLRGR